MQLFSTKFLLQRPLQSSKKNISFKRSSLRVRAQGGQKGGIGDDLLDFLEAGPKMRRWYGQEERSFQDEDFNQSNKKKPGQKPEENVVKDKVLVIHTDSLIDEILLLQLILKQQKLKILCGNADEIKTGFGPYATIISGDPNNQTYLKNILKDVKIVITVGPIGALNLVAKEANIQNIIALSMVGAKSGFLDGLLDGEQNILKDQNREKQIINSGVNYSILRVGGLNNGGRGSSKVQIVQSSEQSSNQLSQIGREDVGELLASIAESCDQLKNNLNLSVVAANQKLDAADAIKQLVQK
eukprot:TRINITY_DN3780_c0_g5_i1.p2 TRINITY_DN3780_c0_g5~~TRINITY_DN3780_c0_g5_i1.p2  ORF type:complete len:298 (+),score=63.25 TRINITY_DN3780_c0_g5_i1:59-952(+)